MMKSITFRGLKLIKNEKETPRIKKVPLRNLTGSPQVTLLSQLLNYFEFLNETSQVPQILSESFLKQEKFGNGGVDVDVMTSFSKYG